MSKLGRLWNWLLPGLIHLNPMVATAYYVAVAKDETSHDGSASVGWDALVSNAPKDMPLVAMVDVPRPALLGR
jgi:hypothetical protein